MILEDKTIYKDERELLTDQRDLFIPGRKTEIRKAS